MRRINLRDLVLFRHTHSLLNFAMELANNFGHYGMITPEFIDFPDEEIPVTTWGIWLMQESRRWIRENLGLNFDQSYVSPFLRTEQTFCLSGIRGPVAIEEALIERNLGGCEKMSKLQRQRLYGAWMARRRELGIHWAYPNGGQSVLDMHAQHLDFVLSLDQRHPGGRVICVTHGDRIRALRYTIQDMTPDEWVAVDCSTNPKEMTQNCHVVHYTSIDPETGEDLGYLAWWRSVCPWDPALSTNAWARFQD